MVAVSVTGDLERLSDGGEEDEIDESHRVWRKQVSHTALIPINRSPLTE
jgi:hypothetical protein